MSGIWPWLNRPFIKPAWMRSGSFQPLPRPTNLANPKPISSRDTCAIEKDLPTPSYTINTIRALSTNHPGNQWYFILGGDMLADLPLWREPGQIVEMAGLVVMPRPGSTAPNSEDLRLKLGKPVRLLALEGPALEVSSGWIRSTLASGGSVRYLVPRAVERYIQEHELYGAAEPADPEKPLAQTGVTNA